MGELVRRPAVSPQAALPSDSHALYCLTYCSTELGTASVQCNDPRPTFIPYLSLCLLFSLDFYFTSSCDNYQRTLVYRTALLFSSAPLSAPLHVEEYVEEWVDRCNVSIEGSGGPLTMEEEADFHLSEQRAKAEGGGGAAESEEEEEEEEEEEGEEEEAETDRKPYMIVFPSAKRVIDFIAYLGTEGLYNIWLHSEEGEEEPDEEEYTPTTRMWWRMNESEWIPAYC